MKKYISVILTLCMMFTVGCSTKDEVKQEEIKNVSVIAPDGLPAISIAKLAHDKSVIKEGYEVTYTVESTTENLSTAVMKQEPDIAIVPSNMAAVAYNKTQNYNIAGTVGMGSFYLVSTEDIKSISDIVGMEVGNTGKGLTPDITVQSILKEKGVNVDDVNFTYVNAASELVPLLATGKLNTAFVPEPALTGLLAKNSNLKVICSLNDEWMEVNKSENGYPQATVIVKSDFAKDNEEFVNKFLESLSQSIDFANESSSEVGTFANELGVSTDAGVIAKSMQRANLKFKYASDMINDYNKYFEKLFEFAPDTIGGSLPDEKIYFTQK
jgi:NitT/TauT family transport system substrate-binding protein